MDWNVENFVRCDATLASLVPAQVHDLVTLGRRAPATLRHILVGGGAFQPDLQERARALGWPVLASYGMSECASTVTVEDVLLTHLAARAESDGRIAVRGGSLFTAYVHDDGAIVDPKVDGWFISDDFGEINERTVRVRGRASDFVKIGGESVDLKRLDAILDSVRGALDAAIVALDDERLGSVIHLVTTIDAPDVVAAFNERVLPFERIRATHCVGEIPRSSLGKLLRNDLTRRIRK